MRVFLDTNVIVSAVATRGLCADVFREVMGRHRLVISGLLLDEVRKILLSKIGAPAELVEDVLRLLREDSIDAEPSSSPAVSLLGQNDRALISSALNGNTDLFVTGDRDLIKLGQVEGLAILSPRAFWERIRCEPAPSQ